VQPQARAKPLAGVAEHGSIEAAGTPMIAYGTVLTLLVNSTKGILALIKRERARTAARDYLRAQYGLSEPVDSSAGYTFSGWTRWLAYGDDWSRAVLDSINVIMAKRSPDDECYRRCGELAMFVSVIEIGNIHINGDPKPLHTTLKDLENTDTYRSLLEMGRGRGGDYALKLIQQELRSHFDGHLAESVADGTQ